MADLRPAAQTLVFLSMRGSTRVGMSRSDPLHGAGCITLRQDVGVDDHLAALAGRAELFHVTRIETDAVDEEVHVVADGVVADQLGSVEPGKRADLVLVEGDPRELASLDKRVRAVFMDGRPVAGAV